MMDAWLIHGLLISSQTRETTLRALPGMLGLPKDDKHDDYQKTIEDAAKDIERQGGKRQ